MSKEEKTLDILQRWVTNEIDSHQANKELSDVAGCTFLKTESHQPDVCKVTMQPCDKKYGELCEVYQETMYSYN